MSALLAVTGSALAADDGIDLGGTAYFDYFVDTTDWPDDYNDEPVQGFQFRRAYVAMEKGWDDLVFNFTSDVDYKYGTGNLNIYTKYAYLQWKGLVPGAALLIGQHSPKTHGWVEKRWHYRSVAETMSDMNKWTNSAEVGIGLQGKAVEEKLEYCIGVNNGNGYKKKVAKDGVGAAARLAFAPTRGTHVSALLTSNTPGGDDDEAESYLEGLAGYEEDRFGFFAQYGIFTDGNNDDTESSGLSLFGRARIQERLYALARFDLIDPDTDLDDDGHNLIIAGLDFEARKGLHLQPTFHIKTFQADNRMDDGVELPDSESELVVTAFIEY